MTKKLDDIENLAKSIDKEIKTGVKEARKGEKKMKNYKSLIETVKTVVIVALVASIVAFISGVQYAKQNDASVKQQVNDAVSQVKMSKQ